MAQVTASRPVVITAAEARGSDEPANGSVGDTLLPMLVALIGLTLLGVVAALVATVF